VGEGRSLSQALPTSLIDISDARQRSLLKELAYGTLRWFGRLDALARALLQRPLKPKDRDLHCLLLVGMYQLCFTELPAHAAVHATVGATQALNKDWARGLVNGVLRSFQRRRAELEAALADQPEAQWSHPQWLMSRLQEEWPDHWQEILAANNQRPPMMLRVNQRRGSRDDYRERLAQADIEADSVEDCATALCLRQPVPVERLPGFDEGWASVQDLAAQLVVPLLCLKPGMRVLDACAAPGGKTAHILEQQPALENLVALDRDPHRLRQIDENLERLGLDATIRCADAVEVDEWWDGQLFDRVLLDAPCTATGVIRRHPDIKWLRRSADVDNTVRQQRRLLEALWPLLKPGGMLLYCTCSVLREENQLQMAQFLSGHRNANEGVIEAPWGQACRPGRQRMPGEANGDGFYYARAWKA
jgi:16S rRNA (cytosine967-C5)-methyltransferase